MGMWATRCLLNQKISIKLNLKKETGMNTQEEIKYQNQLLREMFQSDMIKAFNMALTKIENLEECFSNAMFLFNEAMSQVKQKESKLVEIGNLCKVASDQYSPIDQIVSVINRKEKQEC
jgi:hypothetical protein